MTSYWCETALLPDGLARRVLVSVVDGRFASVVAGVDPGDAQVLNGLVVPGLANCHSHAFHRALRGRTQTERGTFWTWREQMYAVAAALTPDTYYELARPCTPRWCWPGSPRSANSTTCTTHPAAVGTTTPNAMGTALIAAARDAGLRIALLDTCYIAGGIDQPLNEVQQRFSDGDATAWASRVVQLAGVGRCRDRCGRAFGARRSAGSARCGRLGVSRRTAAYPSVRAGRGERGLPGGVRPDPDAGARRGRVPVRADECRACDASDARSTSGCSGAPRRTRASARRPSAISRTGSGRRSRCATPVRR